MGRYQLLANARASPGNSIGRTGIVRTLPLGAAQRAMGWEMSMKLLLKVTTCVLLVMVSGCVAGSEASQQAVQNGNLSQLLLGFWHGIIAPFTLIGEIINTFAPNSLPWTFEFYEVRGANVLYNAGFFIGMFVGPSGLWTAVTRRRTARSRSKL